MPSTPDRRPPAPAAPQGWRPGPPDYVGVGTARSGTTWWAGLIGAHPRVSHPPGTPKEVHFFDGLWDRGLDEADVARYHAFFARPEGHLSGEWTPGYMLDVWTPRLLRQAAPEARLLVLLRDPVERFRSGRTLAENRFTIGSTARAAANAAFNRGIYADQLLRLWAAFPREQVLVLQYERCVADPATELRRTLEFVGLDPTLPRDLDPGGRVNESRGPKVTLSAWQEDQLVRRYAPENERLATLLPDLDLSLWRAPR
jgi:Sulfotransferase domain